MILYLPSMALSQKEQKYPPCIQSYMNTLRVAVLHTMEIFNVNKKNQSAKKIQ